ncbi:helix-turn-helix transcriptional regulator [Streptomyces sp. SD15]
MDERHATLLEGRPGICVTGESTPGPDAAAALRARRPHVLMAHSPLPADRARDLARAVGDGVRPLTMGEPAPGPSGPAHGPLPATAGRPASAVVLAAAGCTFVHETAQPPHRTAASRESPVSHVSPDQLTERECEVLELLARGLSDGEIAAQLCLSAHTVKSDVRNLPHKPRLRNRSTRRPTRSRPARAIPADPCQRRVSGTWRGLP